jgi:hypothetical protein
MNQAGGRHLQPAAARFSSSPIHRDVLLETAESRSIGMLRSNIGQAKPHAEQWDFMGAACASALSVRSRSAR